MSSRFTSSRWATLASFCLLMAACQASTSSPPKSDPEGAPPTVQESTTPSSTAGQKKPSSSPEPIPASKDGPAKNIPVPKISKSATKPTAAGAAAFLEHYFDLMNYALETYDTDPLVEVTSRSCIPCGENFIDPLWYNDDLGHWQVGGDYHLEVTAAQKPRDTEATVIFRFTTDPVQIYQSPNNVIDQSSGTSEPVHGVSTLVFDSGWKLRDFNFDSKR